ncbi:MAG: hypothetical protein ABEJ76_07050 [Halanaeroarchaeum sp.]
MYAPPSTPVRLEARVRVRVPRNDDGTLEDGLRTVLARVDDVEHVDDVEMLDLTPRLNDMVVEARVAVRLAAAEEPPADRLAGGFGVDGVTVEHVSPVDAPGGSPRLEYG